MKIHVERFQRYMLAFDITLLGNAGFIDGRFSSAIDSDPKGQCFIERGSNIVLLC